MSTTTEQCETPGPPWVAIAANPYSGSGRNRRRVEKLAEALGRHGLAARMLWDPEERGRVLRDGRLMQSCRCVVAAGGDGTVADVINERTGVPLAVLPLGLENLFAREFGFPADPAALARVVAAGARRRIDLGRAGGRLFSLMLTAGIDAAAVHRFDRWRDHGRGLRPAAHLSYLRPGLQTLGCYRFPRLEIEADGERAAGSCALVFNLCAYALRIPFAPGARADDGLLDWVVFEKPGVGRALGFLWDVLRRRHLSRPDVRHGRARRVRIAAAEPVPVQVDGDGFGATPVEAEALPRALEIIAPDAPQGPKERRP